MSDDTLLVLDTETTGTDLKTTSIVQLAVVRYSHDAQHLCLLNSYCVPQHQMEEGALKIHGIVPETYQWAPHETYLLWQLHLMLLALGGPERVILVSHNGARFDIPLIDTLYPPIELASYRHIDTYTSEMRMDPGGAHKLGLAYAKLSGQPEINAHDAGADCIMTAEILRLQSQANPDMSPDLWVQWQDQPMVLSLWPWGKYKGTPLAEVPVDYIKWCQKRFTEVHADVTATMDARLYPPIKGAS